MNKHNKSKSSRNRVKSVPTFKKLSRKIGGEKKMVEKLVEIEKSPIKFKKYRAIVTSDYDKYRNIDFGDNRYQQYKDSTKLKIYAKLDHGDKKRRKNYFMRHSGVPNKRDALKKEIIASNGKYNAKILSHKYLW